MLCAHKINPAVWLRSYTLAHLHIHTHAHTHTHMHTHTRARIHTYPLTHLYTFKHTHTHIHTHGMHTYPHTHTHAHTHAHLHTHIPTPTPTATPTHTYTHHIHYAQALFIEFSGFETTLAAMKRMPPLALDDAADPHAAAAAVGSMVYTHGCQALSKLAFNIMTQVGVRHTSRSRPQ
jgi:hypothetical protein